jgi:starvation-inducible DNA-binding protein
LHLLFDKHYREQLALIYAFAERVQTPGGVALALAQDVIEECRISRAPRDRERPREQLHRLLTAHEILLLEARPMAREADSGGDEGTGDLIVRQLVRTHGIQNWFIGEHLSCSSVTE